MPCNMYGEVRPDVMRLLGCMARRDKWPLKHGKTLTSGMEERDSREHSNHCTKEIDALNCPCRCGVGKVDFKVQLKIKKGRKRTRRDSGPDLVTPVTAVMSFFVTPYQVKKMRKVYKKMAGSSPDLRTGIKYGGNSALTFDTAAGITLHQPSTDPVAARNFVDETCTEEADRVFGVGQAYGTEAKVRACVCVALWLCGAVALWRCGSASLWLCGAVALHCCIAVSLRLLHHRRLTTPTCVGGATGAVLRQRA